jgi:hypothetical protein
MLRCATLVRLWCAAFAIRVLMRAGKRKKTEAFYEGVAQKLWNLG